MNQRLVPNTFDIPQLLQTNRLRIRPLTINDVTKDFDAVITSVSHLIGVFGPDSTWPPLSLTLEQDLIDLGWHQKEFQTRRSFAYTVVSPDERQCLGCAYIYPSRNPAYDAMVIAWIRQSEVADGLEQHLLDTVRGWLDSSWPFERVGFPGRDISWTDWNAGCVTIR